jgi:hypothetical protein
VLLPGSDLCFLVAEGFRMLCRILRLLVSCLAALAYSASLASVASASGAEKESDDATITWMVRPSDGVGEDGRSWVELELAPGQTTQDHLLIRNLSRDTVTFTLTAADGYFTDTGRFTMLTADEESTDAGTWITIQDTVEVASGADVIVPFSVSVPHDATPGDHAAGVAAAIRSGGDGVGIESRVGFRVMTRVSGELAPSATADIAGAYLGTWNPLDTGRLDLEYTVSNTGNTRLSVVPQITATALFGLVVFIVPGDEIVELAPGESRTGRVTVPAAWPLFIYTADVSATATSVSEELSFTAIEPASATAPIVAIPWPQLAVIAMAALLLGWLRVDRRRHDRKLTALIKGSDGKDATEGP